MQSQRREPPDSTKLSQGTVLLNRQLQRRVSLNPTLQLKLLLDELELTKPIESLTSITIQWISFTSTWCCN